MVDNWCTHRDMDSVQESSRCKQTKPSLWPTRPAGRIREPSARSRVRWCSARGSHGMPHVLSGLAPRPRKPEGRTRNREARDRPEGITPTGGSAPNEAHTPNQHTRGKDTPGTPTGPSRQYADCSQQHAIGSWQIAVSQHAVSEGGDTAHAHAHNDTPPRQPHPGEERTAPDTRRTHPTGTPHPGQDSRSGSGSTLDAGRPSPPHRQHRCRCRFHCHCRCGRAGTPTPSAPAPATHPDPGHTGLRRCQPEPQPTRRLDPAAHFDLRHTGFRRCRLQPNSNRPGPGQRPRPTSRLFVADACSSTEDQTGPSQRPRPTLTSSSLTG